MLKLLRSIRWQLAHAHQSLHILARPTQLTENELDSLNPSRFTFHVLIQWVKHPDDPEFPLLLKILAEQGLDEDWARDQLASGSSAILATVEENGQAIPAGVGLYTRGEFYVGEIDHLYHPGPTACYLYATYVSPAWRGRRIQRLLDLHRVKKSAQKMASPTQSPSSSRAILPHCAATPRADLFPQAASIISASAALL